MSPQALFLARQVIDMVEKSGVLGMEGASALLGAAGVDAAPANNHSVTRAAAARRATTHNDRSAGPRAPAGGGHQSHANRLSHQQQALDELRRSIPAMRAALRATVTADSDTQPPTADTDGSLEVKEAAHPGVGGSGGAGASHADQDTAVRSPCNDESLSLARTSSEECDLNPLWQPAAAVSVPQAPSVSSSPRPGPGCMGVVVVGAGAGRVTEDSTEDPPATPITAGACKVMVSHPGKEGLVHSGGNRYRSSSVNSSTSSIGSASMRVQPDAVA